MRFSALVLFIRVSFCAAGLFACVLFGVAGKANAQRLPTTVVPTRYTLSLIPDLKNATFSGVESIDVNIAQSTKTITLNAIELAFQSVTIFPNGPQQTGTVSLDEEKQQATFTFSSVIPAGNATIKIRYTGILNNEPPRLLSFENRATRLCRHAIRGNRRAPRISLLRRACLQGPLRHLVDRRRRRYRHFQHLDHL